MYWRGLPAQEKIKYSLLYSYFYTVFVMSRDERDSVLVLEMVTGRVARGPGRAGPKPPGPRAQTGRKFFIY